MILVLDVRLLLLPFLLLLPLLILFVAISGSVATAVPVAISASVAIFASVPFLVDYLSYSLPSPSKPVPLVSPSSPFIYNFLCVIEKLALSSKAFH